MNRNYDFLYKIVFFGDSGVGKSSLLLRFTEDTFPVTYFTKSGVDFKIRTLTLDNKVIKLQIWDAVGLVRFHTLYSRYFRGAHGVIVVYDVTNRDSFDNIKNWMSEVDKYGSDPFQRLLVGNKSDLVSLREVDYTTAREYAESLKIPLIETSAKCGTNVEQAFVTMTAQILTHLRTEIQPVVPPKRDRIELSKKERIGKKTCFI